MATKKKTSKKSSSDSIYDEFEETSTKRLKKLREEEEEFVKTKSGSDFIQLSEGENKLRIYPKRKNVDDAFYRMRSVWWLPFRKDNGDLTRTTVNNAKIHGNFQHDIVEEYINLGLSMFSSGDEEDNTKIERITDWKQGISNQVTFISYAAKVLSKTKKEFGLWEMKPSLKDDLMKECIIEDEDEAIELDPYTSPRDGKCAIISYKSAAKGAKKYAVRLSKFDSPLTPEELKKFKLLPALYEHPLFKYGLKDFEKALECLEVFDEEYEIGLFDTEEFKRIIKNVRKEFKEISTDKDNKKGSKKKTSKKEVEEEDEDEEDDQYSDNVEDDDDDENPIGDDDDEDDEEGEDIDDDDDEDLDEEEEDTDDDDEEVEDDDDEEEEEEKPKKKAKKSEVSLSDIKKKLGASEKKKKKKK